MTKTQEKLFNILSDPKVEVTRTHLLFVPFGDNGLTKLSGKIRVEFNKDPYTLDINRTEYNEILPRNQCNESLMNELKNKLKTATSYDILPIFENMMFCVYFSSQATYI